MGIQNYIFCQLNTRDDFHVLVFRAVVAESQPQSGPHDQEGKPPSNGVIQLLPFLKVHKNFPDVEVEVDALAELP